MAYIYEKKSLKLTTLKIVFDAGSMFEKEGRYGTMHLMEHIVCKTFKDMYDELQKNCIEWNAYTTDEMVCFHFDGVDAYLTPAIKKKLVKKILGGIDKVGKTVFETEKNVVLQEYADTFNDNVCGQLYNIMRTHYDTFGPIGKRSDIEAFTFNDAKEVYAEFFSKPARIIEIGPTKTDFSDIEYADENAHEMKKMRYKKVKNEIEQVPPSDKSFFFLLGKKTVSKADYPFMQFAITMLCGGLNSPFYEEIRVKNGLSYFCHAELNEYRKDSIFNFTACTTKENEQNLRELYTYLIDNLDKYMTKERFELVYKQAEVELMMKKIMRVKHDNDLVRKGLVCMPKNLKKITFEKTLEVAKKYITMKNIDMIVLNGEEA